MSNSPRRPLHARSNSETNRIRLVPPEPPQLLGHHHQNEDDNIYRRTPLPTHPAHILLPNNGKSHGYGSVYGYSHAKETGSTTAGTAAGAVFQPSPKANQLPGSDGSSVSTAHQAAQIINSATTPPNPNPKPLSKKRLAVKVGDKKTFSLVPHDGPQSPDEGPSLSTQSSFSSLRHVESRSNSSVSCDPIPEQSTGTAAPTTPAPKSKNPISADAPPIGNSPWNYQFVGGLRKVAKTPDLKEKAAVSDGPLPPLPSLPETSDEAPPAHDLLAKPSFQSTRTTTTTSENTNYKVYRDISPSLCETALVPPSSSDSNYEILGESTPSSVIHRPLSGSSENYASSVIHRPQTGTSDNENYELHNESSPSVSYVSLLPHSSVRYSQESLVVPPLKPRAKRSNESFGYYKSRSRESLRSGSLTSISTVLTQQEAYQAIVGSGSLIQLPILSQKARGLSSWAELSGKHPQRSHMQEHPHQWSSQLSTVLSESDGGTERGSRSWSDDTGRRSSGFPSSPSRQSRRMLSISSSLAQEEEAASRSISDPIESPRPAFSRNGQQRNYGNPLIEDQDEHGDGITDMQDLRQRPSRSRLSGFFSVTSSNEGRSNTMRSTTSSRANSLLANSIPTWAKLYYGSGERRYLGAPGSSTEGSSESRNNSLLSRSPSTDGFPLGIYSPRRRPREVQRPTGRRSTRNSLEITPAQQLENEGRVIEDYPRQHRTWSLLSSVWSPHLRTDRRATRHSVWEPPSVNWSTEGGWFGRRNVQIIMFVAGFIFPFAWMIAALLPLPPDPMLEMRERDHSTSNLDANNNVLNDYAREFGPMDEARYESAFWWRRLNRWMSLVGVIIIAVIIVLVVIGTRGWK